MKKKRTTNRTKDALQKLVNARETMQAKVDSLEGALHRCRLRAANARARAAEAELKLQHMVAELQRVDQERSMLKAVVEQGITQVAQAGASNERGLMVFLVHAMRMAEVAMLVVPFASMEDRETDWQLQFEKNADLQRYEVRLLEPERSDAN
jgi:chromosome segregation ATPase